MASDLTWVESCRALHNLTAIYCLTSMQNVRVELGSRTYRIAIGPSLIANLGVECKNLNLGQKCAIVSDSNVSLIYGETVFKSLKSAGFDPVLITIPAGEISKNLSEVQSCYELLAHHRVERKSFIVALGGGVVGDLAGFLAATYLRGVPLVQVPTTLLAQVDSSVGGKVGVNLKAGKNLVGAFYQPRYVACDQSVFATLPDREYKAGLAEVIKYGIIYDRSFFVKIEQNLELLLKRDPVLLSEIVARCCQIKAEIVGQDETETGLRAILNFGHTIGHGLEAISGYGQWLHGEAISIGQIAAARLSARLLGFPQIEVDRIRSLFSRVGLPTHIALPASDRRRLLDAMNVDKKVVAGEIKFVLARTIGTVEFGHGVPEDLLMEIVETLHEQGLN